MPHLETYLVIAKRGSFFAFGKEEAVRYANKYHGVYLRFEIVRERLEQKPIGKFILPTPEFSIQ